jgi:3-methyl-2-oxobutanoate hydroxymethyltransferase
MPQADPRVRTTDLLEMKRSGRKIAVLTAYDATIAGLLDRAGIDVLLVGDSAAMVVMGHETTLPVTLEAMIHHASAVVRGARRALVVADMPFLTYQASVADAVRNAGRLLQESGAAAVKLEGGRAILDAVRRLVDVGIPVMGHVGLIPQSVHQLGGYRAVGKTAPEAERIVEDAIALEQSGAFAVVLESIPAALAQRVTKTLAIPTIGIGAGIHCDGQVLVSYDAFGIFDAFVPRFVRQYAEVGKTISGAAKTYIDEVRSGAFPGPEHSILKPGDGG